MPSCRSSATTATTATAAAAGGRSQAVAPAVAALLVLALAAPAAAHQSSVKYVDVTVDGARAEITLTVAPSDVTEPLGLPADARPSVEQASTPAVAAHVAGWLAISPAGGPPCPASGQHVRTDVDPRSRSPERGDPDGSAGEPGGLPRGIDRRFVVVAWQVQCSGELARPVLDFRAFFAVDARHEAIVTVHPPGEPGDAQVVRAGAPVLAVEALGSAGSARVGLLGWLSAGVAHIWDGRDHVCFVLALLLVVVLARTGGGWTLRPPGITLRTTAAIVTAFTIAHSASLIAASLGWIELPGRLVESVIAFSILYTAIENIVRPDVRWRFALTFGFGLIHGLGFASMLRVMLPADQLAIPLIGFNLGVELGQLVIVAISLPLIWLAGGALGAGRYRRTALPIASAAIAVVAIKWLVERALEIELPTLWGM